MKSLKFAALALLLIPALGHAQQRLIDLTKARCTGTGDLALFSLNRPGLLRNDPMLTTIVQYRGIAAEYAMGGALVSQVAVNERGGGVILRELKKNPNDADLADITHMLILFSTRDPFFGVTGAAHGVNVDLARGTLASVGSGYRCTLN